MRILNANPRKCPILKYLALFIGLVLISGCGFALRGGGEMSSVLATMSIVGGNKAFNEQLRQRLQQSGIIMVKTDGHATLFISKNDYQRSARTLDATGLATSYNYTYSIDYVVRDHGGGVLQPANMLFRHSTLQHDAVQILQIEAEEAFLKKQMEQEIISQLLIRLRQIE